MSLDMTFRQKLIRIGCSAAICGLSFSFIIGETVDREAKQLRSWSTDPTLLPQAFLPLRPMTVAAAAIESPGWREQLVAINSLPVRASPSTLRPQAEDVEVAVIDKAPPSPYNNKKSETVEAHTAISPNEQVKSVSAAPERAAEPLRAPEPELRLSEVEVVLASIHTATARLSRQGLKTVPTESAPEVSKSNKPKGHTPEAVVTVRPQPPAALLAASKRQNAEAVTGAPWILAGRILSSTAMDSEPGHYEVGLYSKIDPDNHPVGYPLPQQILPAGQSSFRLEVPHRIERGYLFAEFVSAKTGKRTYILPAVNPWTRGNHLNAELIFRAEDKISTVAAAAISKEAPKEQWKIRGTVTTMFAGQGRIAQGDVVVKVRGRKEAARTDRNGMFSLELPRIKGTTFLEVLKAGYHPAIVTLSAEDSQPLDIEIASRHAVEQISQRLGASQSSLKGIFIGRAVGAEGAGLRGMTAQLSLKADGPFYFDDDGVATRDLRSTSGNGRFLFLNVEAGTGYLETSINGDTIAPLQVSTVEGGEMIQKWLTPVAGSLRGRIFNPVAESGKMSPIGGARVRIDGASEWVNTDSFGAFSIGPMKWLKGERVSLEVTAEKFNNHRYQVSPDSGAGLNLFAFPAQYLGRLARSMDLDLDPYAGVIVGKVSGPPVRMDALADHSVVNSARDFYFDSKGRLKGSHEMTDPRYGTYIIFNVPKGRTLLHGNDSTGQLRYSEGIVSSAASINVLMD